MEAGSRVRHLGLGYSVRVRIRDVETVAFGRRTAGVEPAVSGREQSSLPASPPVRPTS